MVRLIFVLSGQIAAGKSTLSNQLADRFGFHVLKTNQLLKDLATEEQQTRDGLQTYGEALDKKTKGSMGY